jgi:hypothetical protein
MFVMDRLEAGAVFAGRFHIEKLAGRGGMGAVYRARDGATGGLVALKLLFEATKSASVMARLGREASLLAALRHEGIVAYVAHGQTAEGQLYLAMEWIDGIELTELLRHGSLSIADGVALLRALAEALAAAHRQGVVHRDLKPSNIFLREGRLGAPVLLDFGIARHASGAQPLTATGAMIGTPAYMSPEQIRGERGLGPASDVFSLGCVIHECIAGRGPFSGESVAAILSAILLAEPQRLDLLVPDVPAPLAALLHRLLAKNPVERLADAAALLAALDALGPLTLSTKTSVSRTAATVTRTRPFEQQLISVVLAAAPGSGGSRSESRVPQADLETLLADGRGAEVRAALRGMGVQAEWLVGDMLVATSGASGSALDQATLAARAALLLRELWPESLVAVATGRASVVFDRPLGEAVDRASGLIAEQAMHRTTVPREAGHTGGAEILVDELSADLIAARFVVERTPEGLVLQGERAAADDERLLLGRPSPCVGREQELSILEALFAGCVDDAVARTALVTAPPGTGKSRLRREFTKRIASRAPEVRIVTAASELVGAGTPLGVLGRLVRRLCDVQAGDAPAQQRAALAAHLAALVPEGDRERVLDFLAEACRLSPVEPSARLCAARSDPKRMSEQILRAFAELVRGECARGPLVLLLEDLQWGDVLSVQIFDAIPRELGDEALLLVAFARPEVRDQFPRLWASSGRTEIALPGLSRKAAERLVRAMRGADVDRATVARIVAQADGNALFLEELIRADAEGRGDALPPSVLAMLQARLSRFEPAIRRLLRAASTFGETFWRGPLASLLRCAADHDDFVGWLQFLVDAEIVELRHESRLVGESEYVFRHALVREAVYALVADDEREAWHREAAALLERLGERDPLVLAEHHFRGGDLLRGCACFLQAAEESLRANDLTGALGLVARGLDCHPAPEERGRLLQIRSHALVWSFRWNEAWEAAREALPLLTEGRMPWFEALWITLTLSGILGDDETLERAGAQLLAATPPREGHFVYVRATSTVSSMYALRARRAPADRYLARLEAFAQELASDDLQSRAWVHRARSDHARAFDLDPWLQTREAGEAARLMAEAENEREWSFFRVFHAHSLGELGQTDAGEAQLRDVLARCARFPDAYIEASCRLHLADLLVDVGVRDDDETRLLEAADLARAVAARSGVSEGYRRWCERLLAVCAFARGDLESAERHAREAAVPTAAALRHLAAVALRARVLLAMGARDAAQQEADALRDWLGAHGTAGYVEVAVRLAIAEVSEATGFSEAASAERRAAQALVERCAARIPESESRSEFLSSSVSSAAVRCVGEPRRRASRTSR